MRPSEWVDGSRLWNRLMDLARFGAREDGGVDRQTLTDAEIAARAQVVAWGRALGLSPYTDAAANLFLRFEGRDQIVCVLIARVLLLHLLLYFCEDRIDRDFCDFIEFFADL